MPCSLEEVKEKKREVGAEGKSTCGRACRLNLSRMGRGGESSSIRKIESPGKKEGGGWREGTMGGEEKQGGRGAIRRGGGARRNRGSGEEGGFPLCYVFFGGGEGWTEWEDKNFGERISYLYKHV